MSSFEFSFSLWVLTLAFSPDSLQNSKPNGNKTMRFMIIVKATKDTEAGLFPPDKEKLFADMATYHEELKKAGMLLDGSGLQPSSKGWRIQYSKGKTTVVDGPFAETKDLVAGYTLIQAKSRKDALACG